MMKLLTREEWQYLEGHKEFYEDTMIENQLPHTLPDGSINTNPPERCTGPLYSQDCPQEDTTIVHYYQAEKLIEIKPEVKEENEDIEEKTEVTGGRQCIEEGDMMVISELGMPDGSGNRNPPERCTGSLYPQDCAQEDATTPYNYQNGKKNNLSIIGKEEVKEEEGADSVMEEAELSGGQQDLCSDFKTESSIHINPPERSTGPLYSQDCLQESHSYALQYETKKWIYIKREVKEETEEDREEEAEVTGGRQCMEEGDMMVISELGMPDGSGNRNPPERCTGSLYPQDFAQEDATSPYNYQNGKHNNLSTTGEQEVKEEEGADSVMEEAELSGGHKDLSSDFKIESSIHTNSPQKITGPLYSQDCLQEGHSYALQYETEKLIYIKCEVKEEKEEDVEEETEVTGGRQCMEEDMMVTSGLGMPVSDRNDVRNPSEVHPISPPDGATEDDGVTQCSPITGNTHHRDHSVDGSHSDPEESSDQLHFIEAPSNAEDCECGECFSKKSILTIQSHLTKRQACHTGIKPFSCSECGKTFLMKGNLVRHFRIHTGEKPYSCSECGKCFSDSGNLLKHMRIHTGESSLSYSEYGQSFFERVKFQTHLTTYTGERPYSCSECGKRFTLKSNLVRHFRIHTGEKPYSCSECGKCYSDSGNLLKHMRMHTGESPLSYSECGNNFVERVTFQRHLTPHTVERPYSCSECGKCFSDSENFMKHMRMHTGESTLSYSECGNNYVERVTFQRHMTTHTVERPYSCSECGNRFTLKSNLVRHFRIHTGEKPYSCSECGKSYSDSGNLLKHKRMHTGETPLSCSECGKNFYDRVKFQRHMKTHTGESPYSYLGNV
ncbi:uncharacterized protein [Hyperolius riggenbachi]